MSTRRNWDSPNPSPAGECALGWGSPNSDHEKANGPLSHFPPNQLFLQVNLDTMGTLGLLGSVVPKLYRHPPLLQTLADCHTNVCTVCERSLVSQSFT